MSCLATATDPPNFVSNNAMATTINPPFTPRAAHDLSKTRQWKTHIADSSSPGEIQAQFPFSCVATLCLRSPLPAYLIPATHQPGHIFTSTTSYHTKSSLSLHFDIGSFPDSYQSLQSISSAPRLGKADTFPFCVVFALQQSGCISHTRTRPRPPVLQSP